MQLIKRRPFDPTGGCFLAQACYARLMPAAPSRLTPPSSPSRSTALKICLAFFLIAAAPIKTASADGTLPIWREIFARPPTGISQIPAPPDNPLTREKIRLGQTLFADTRLSGAGNRSCATCHDADRDYTDGRARAKPIDGKTRLANTPTLFNLAWAGRFFWDGRANSLEEQAPFPIEHPQEMAGSWGAILSRLSADRALDEQLRKAFPHNPEPTKANIVAALASFERSLVSPLTRFDEFVSGKTASLSRLEQQGFALFVGKAGCVSCHSGWRFTDDRLHRTGLSRQAMKTPTLRGLSSTAPFMHDGSRNSIREVIAHYAGLPQDDPTLSPNLIRPMQLSAYDTMALIAFIKSIDERSP
ncbi:MAG: hypothetical protein KJ622_08475 [Alphaproteobacteria bacterium]|nr:hypothetical protein [Alphaproteobacteria bacterium]